MFLLQQWKKDDGLFDGLSFDVGEKLVTLYDQARYDPVVSLRKHNYFNIQLHYELMTLWQVYVSVIILIFKYAIDFVVAICRRNYVIIKLCYDLVVALCRYNYFNIKVCYDPEGC